MINPGNDAWDIIKLIAGRTIKNIYRIFYFFKNNTNSDNGILEIEFIDGLIILFDGASDGESLKVTTGAWLDPFDGKLDEENLRFIQDYGKWSLFNMSNTAPYNSLLNSIITQCYPIINQFGKLCGIQMLTDSSILNFVVEADESHIYWGNTNNYFEEMGYKVLM